MAPFMGCIGVAPDFEEVSSLVGPYETDRRWAVSAAIGIHARSNKEIVFICRSTMKAPFSIWETCMPRRGMPNGPEWPWRHGELRVSCELIKKKSVAGFADSTPASLYN